MASLQKPFFTQEQATRWLGAMARGLQKHGQTIFLIEQLQPSWLPTRTQRSAYVLASRLLEGLLFTMIPVLIFHRLMQAELLRGLFFALTFASIFAVVDLLRLESDLFRRGGNGALPVWQAAVIVSVVVLAVGLTAEWLQPGEGLINALFGLAWGPAWASRSAIRNLTNDIQPVETTRWSWSAALQGGARAAGVIALLLLAVRVMPSDQRKAFLEILFRAAPVVLLMGAIDVGLKRRVVELKTVPNQGIRLSSQTAAWTAGMVSLAGLIAGLIDMIWRSHDPKRVVYGLLFGVLCGVFLALLKGGLEVLRHGILRVLIVRAGCAPPRPAAFLDYAADELHFLQKVGAGYMFIHRYLLEHFAALGESGSGSG